MPNDLFNQLQGNIAWQQGLAMMRGDPAGTGMKLAQQAQAQNAAQEERARQKQMNEALKRIDITNLTAEDVTQIAQQFPEMGIKLAQMLQDRRLQEATLDIKRQQQDRLLREQQMLSDLFGGGGSAGGVDPDAAMRAGVIAGNPALMQYGQYQDERQRGQQKDEALRDALNPPAAQPGQPSGRPDSDNLPPQSAASDAQQLGALDFGSQRPRRIDSLIAERRRLEPLADDARAKSAITRIDKEIAAERKAGKDNRLMAIPGYTLSDKYAPKDTDAAKARKMVSDRESFVQTIDDLKKMYRKHGGVTSIMNPTVSAQYKAKQKQLAIAAKGLFDLGALQQPDIELIEKLMIDPTGIAAAYAIDDDAILSSMDDVKRKVMRDSDTALRMMGYEKNEAEQEESSDNPLQQLIEMQRRGELSPEEEAELKQYLRGGV